MLLTSRLAGCGLAGWLENLRTVEVLKALQLFAALSGNIVRQFALGVSFPNGLGPVVFMLWGPIPLFSGMVQNPYQLDQQMGDYKIELGPTFEPYE
jgi:hypothetical protein